MRIRVEITARDTTAHSGRAIMDPVVVSAVTMTDRASIRPGVPPSFVPMPEDSAMAIPPFSFRVPLRAVTGRLTQIPGVGGVRYPSSRRQSGTSGQAQLSFVVDLDGRPEEASIQVVNATQREFAAAALDAMPNFRYRPLEVGGCRVRGFTEAPFRFYVAQ